MTQKKQNHTLFAGAIILFAAVLAFALLYHVFAPQPTAGTKSITISVVDDQNQTTTYDVHTDAQFLRQAMQDAKGLTFSGTDSEFGLMLIAVNGLTADWNKNQAWWSIYVNNELASYGIDKQPVTDGDVFCLQYTTEANAER